MAKTNTSSEIVTYQSAGGVTITRASEEIEYERATMPLLGRLNESPGVLLSSSYEYPGRYSRWDIGFCDPPLRLSGRGRSFTIEALNARGQILLQPILEKVKGRPEYADIVSSETSVTGSVCESAERFPEELRSRQPTLFSLLRVFLELFGSNEDSSLGLYGAFGYDLAFQFEPLKLRIRRDKNHRDLVLYLPDEILAVDHYARKATSFRYDFEWNGKSTEGLERKVETSPFRAADHDTASRDHERGEYAELVTKAKEYFSRGDLFEVVPRQKFSEPARTPPDELFSRVQLKNPAPYGFLMNLGENEYLVGASPEMFVRVTGRRVETCPISGTVARGRDAINDAEQILKLLNSKKDLSELTMCTDVDRNDKSRICKPGSIRVLGRRQIEMYSRVIHTVDHIEGELREEFDALDAFLSHAWAVTVTGAPKRWAMQFIEDHERSPRRWYGGAVGVIAFNGDLNTGLTLRTIHIQDGVASVAAGATLLFDSDPDEEERETEMKASAFLDVIRDTKSSLRASRDRPRLGQGKKIFFVDHEDSFVHTLAGYFRETGADVVTHRHGFPEELLDSEVPSLLALSPGPGSPSDFQLSRTIELAMKRNIPIFGICLGLQGLVEYFGGTLGVLTLPMHGKPSRIRALGGRLFSGLEREFEVGRYHSLFGKRETFPKELTITAEAEDGTVMAIEHTTLPIAAVQFHPESIMTLGVGHEIIDNVLRYFSR